MSAKSYSVAELRAGLSSIIGEAARGGEIVVTAHNKAVARIVPVSRVPPLPRVNIAALFKAPPVRLRPGSHGSSRLVRAIRDEE